MQLPSAPFKPTLKKFFYFIIFPEMEISGSNIKKFLIFSYISRNGNPPPPKEFLIFQETETLKSFLYFGKWNS